MRSFIIGFQLQRIALQYMANLYIEAKEKNNLKMIFHSLDDEKDGELEIKELVVQLKEKFDITVRLSEME